MQNEVQPLVYSIDETCDALKISRPTVYRLINGGVLKRVKLGKVARITIDSVRRAAAGEAA